MEKNFMQVEMPVPNFKRKRVTIINLIGNILLSLLIVVMAAYLGFRITCEYHPVEGGSMRPTFNEQHDSQDAVFINRLNKGKVGGIIVAKRANSSLLVIKRLIATGGDKVNISYTEGICEVFVIKSGETEAQKLKYSSEVDMSNDGTYTDFVNYCIHNPSQVEYVDGKKYLKIDEGFVYYLGDNMNDGQSEDCADYGPVNAENIIGSVKFIVYGRKDKLLQVLKQIFASPDCLQYDFI